jgi:hypothetical protein
VLTRCFDTGSCQDDSDGLNIYLAGAAVGGNWRRQRAARGCQNGFWERHSGVRGRYMGLTFEVAGASPKLGAAVGASV